MLFGPHGLYAPFFAVIWLIWLGVGIVAVIAFILGMNALIKLPARLERIERALEAIRTAQVGEGRGGTL